MIDNVYNLWCDLVGIYSPYVNSQTGDFATDWSYVFASVFVIMVAYFMFKACIALIRGLFK